MLGLAVVGTVLSGAWRRDSELHGEAHWRCVAATGLRSRTRPGGTPTASISHAS